jgi:hypothetical protein
VTVELVHPGTLRGITTELTRRAGVALAAAVKAREIRPDQVDEFTSAVEGAEVLDELEPRWRELIEKYAPED